MGSAVVRGWSVEVVLFFVACWVGGMQYGLRRAERLLRDGGCSLIDVKGKKGREKSGYFVPGFLGEKWNTQTEAKAQRFPLSL